jgi:hypothetical protein
MASHCPHTIYPFIVQAGSKSAMGGGKALLWTKSLSLQQQQQQPEKRSLKWFITVSDACSRPALDLERHPMEDLNSIVGTSHPITLQHLLRALQFAVL